MSANTTVITKATETVIEGDGGSGCLDSIMDYIEANTDQEILSKGSVVSSFDW